MSKLMRLWVGDYRFFCGEPTIVKRQKQKIAASGSSYIEIRFPVGAAEGCDLFRKPAYFSNPLEGNISVPRQRRTERWKNRLLGTCTMALPVPASSASIKVV